MRRRTQHESNVIIFALDHYVSVWKPDMGEPLEANLRLWGQGNTVAWEVTSEIARTLLPTVKCDQ